MPRPTKLTPRLRETIRASVAGGNYIDTACAAAGIHTSTYYNWMERGAAGEDPYFSFFEDLKAAQAEAEQNALRIIQAASHESWQAAAWFLERTKHRKFGRTLQHEGGDDKHPVRVAINIIDFTNDTDSGDPSDPTAAAVPIK